MTDLFDMSLRAMRRDRAARHGAELFLHERAFTDCLDRIGAVRRRFASALLVGCPDPVWIDRLRAIAGTVTAIEPGPCFAAAAGAQIAVEDRWSPPAGQFDLCVAVGTLDTVNDLPRALGAIRTALSPDSLLIGALAGGESLPCLRAALRVADQVAGVASAHVHPRIEASALAPLLSSAGLVMPVVDVDRVSLAYPSLQRLVGDLRGMGATNILAARSRRPLSRLAYAAASAAFATAGDGTRTVETIELLHFAAWSPPE